jgi:hypothetical protein
MPIGVGARVAALVMAANAMAVMARIFFIVDDVEVIESGIWYVDLNKGEKMMSNIDCYTSSWPCFIHKFLKIKFSQRISKNEVYTCF